MKYTAPRRLHWLLLISAVIIFLDRLTKTWVTLHIPIGGAIPVIPRVLRITHWTNEGAAFSLFANSASPQAVRWVLICFSLLAALMVLFLLVRLGDRFTFTTVALALVFAGALGNVHDRIAQRGPLGIDLLLVADGAGHPLPAGPSRRPLHLDYNRSCAHLCRRAGKRP